MREDYKAARKLAEAAVKKANREGVSPYLPVLDSRKGFNNALPQSRVGLMELPLSRIVGNKEAARGNAFANNFMPLLEDGTEFAMKWSDLYDSYRQEGIRDAIKVYEYLNDYYVQEGNKRVSVSHFGGTDFIMADVIRVLPEKNDTTESRVYYEYLDFYNATKIYLIIFTSPGDYWKLATILGQDLQNPWPEDLCKDLKSAYFRFSKNMKVQMKVEDDRAISDAFLVYCAIFPLGTLLESTDDQIGKNILSAKNDLAVAGAMKNVKFLDSAPQQAAKEEKFWDLFTFSKKYTASSPLRVGFVYDDEPDHSRWVDSHEAGRIYVDEVTEKNVVTKSYLAVGGVTNEEAIQQAVSDKCELIFTTSPYMLMETLHAAVKNKDVKFLNCSIGLRITSVRCYQVRLYEASFLMGILAANQLLLEGGDGPRRIGYLSRNKGSRRRLSLNAFAIGVSLVDPECRISLKCLNSESPVDYKAEWKEEGVKIYADTECPVGVRSKGRLGVFRMGETSDTYLGAPICNWGKYYTQIVQSVLMGAWEARAEVEKNQATNYWFGLSSGVIDIRTSKLPYQTKKLMDFCRYSVIRGEISPFSGEIRAQGGRVIQDWIADRPGARADSLENMTPDKILEMDWLNENIDGELV